MSEFKFTEKERGEIKDAVHEWHNEVMAMQWLLDRIETILSEREQDGWVRVEDGEKLPTFQVLAASDRWMLYGFLERIKTGSVICASDETNIFDVTHYKIVNQPNPNK